MGTKRKFRGQSSRKAGATDRPYTEDSKFGVNERFENAEDEFEAGRDHILLKEAPEAKKKRKLEEEEEIFQPSDEEIHGYESSSLDEDDTDEDPEKYEEEEYDSGDLKRPTAKPSRNHKSLSPISDDERPQGEEQEDMGGWGSSKRDYYNADVIETEADALEEEEEAKKIQLKRLQTMNEADFGFDETAWVGVAGDDGVQREVGEKKGTITEHLPELQVSDDMDREDRLKILKQRYPEFEPLSKDFVDLQPIHQDLATATKAFTGHSKTVKEPQEHTSTPLVQFRAVSAYLGAISVYFMLFTSTAKDGQLALAPSELREHPIMETLISCRKQWEQVRGLQARTTEIDISGAESPIDTSLIEPDPQVNVPDKKGKSVKKQKKAKAQRAEEKAQALSEKRRAERLQETELGLAELSKLLEGEGKQPKTKSNAEARDDDSDFGDEPALSSHEAVDKGKKKKSLRFYTSQLAQKANKRSAAGRDAGGDTDLPYRERLKDRQTRLIAEAEKRGRREANETERLGGDSDEEDHRLAEEVRGAVPGPDDDGYYDMVASNKKKKKEEKKKRADAYAEAAREGGEVEMHEEIGPDGKRAISYAIEKNKGLAPKRNKDVRNPRVKKRKKFDEKKKKLGSIRPVYKGGEDRGGYGGELTGIKKNLVKSVKL